MANAKYLLQMRQVGDISGAANEEVGSRRDMQVRTCLSSLAFAADSLTPHWTEGVTYFRGTFCKESWFLGVVAEAAGGLFVGVSFCVCCVGFSPDLYHPFLSSWPMHEDFNTIQTNNTNLKKKKKAPTNLILVGE